MLLPVSGVEYWRGQCLSRSASVVFRALPVSDLSVAALAQTDRAKDDSALQKAVVVAAASGDG